MEFDYMQDPPYVFKIEMVEGCSLACEFCGINGIREKVGGYHFMPEETLRTMSAQLKHAIEEEGWNPRIELAMHGEPSMHPRLAEFIQVIREAVGAKISMVLFSNGTGFVKDPGKTINALLEAGVNTLALDNYEYVNLVPKVLEKYLNADLGHHVYPVYYYPQQREHNLHTGRRVGRRDVVIVQDISIAVDGNHSVLNTHCGGGMKPEPLLQQRCAKPFRELAIRWNGNVAICCNDWRGVYKLGNISEFETLTDLWNTNKFHVIRKYLYQGDRNFDPCDKCNARSTRVGLLPDRMGKVALGEPTPEDREVLLEAISGENYAPTIRRSWESGPQPLNLYDAKKEGR